MSAPIANGTVYKQVIEDVMKNVRQEFFGEDLPETVLAEFQKVWEAKLAQSDTDSQTSWMESEFPTHLSGLFVEGTRQVLQQQPSLGTTTYSSSYGQPTPFLPPQDWSLPPVVPVVSNPAWHAASRVTGPLRCRPAQQSKIPQNDGVDEEEDDDKRSEIKKEKDGDEDLGSDLDDEEGEEPQTENIILCQFEKVTRIKNKRKCNLKAGVMHLNGRDYLFNRANGEFEW